MMPGNRMPGMMPSGQMPGMMGQGQMMPNQQGPRGPAPPYMNPSPGSMVSAGGSPMMMPSHGLSPAVQNQVGAKFRITIRGSNPTIVNYNAGVVKNAA
jgi:hypothetical protein